VQTDWLIVRRLAAEIAQAVRGRRIRDVGLARDDRFIVRTDGATIAIDALGPAPIVSLEAVAIADKSRWWVRSASKALEGLRVDDVRGRRGDRLIAFDCSAQSRFGVKAGYRLVVELVPRFGNVVLLKDDTIVTAAREFPRDRGSVRATVIGDPYEAPPLPSFAADPGAFARALASTQGHGDAKDALAAASRALRAEEPLVPRLVADSIAYESLALVRAGASAPACAERGIARARALVASTDGTPGGLGDVYVYRDAARIVAAHVVPLAQFAGLEHAVVPSLLPIIAEAFVSATAERTQATNDQRRGALAGRVRKRRSALERERDALTRERDDVEGRDRLRVMGDMLYAHLNDVPAGATSFVPPSDPSLTIALDPELDAKGNAAAIFKRYRKATNKLVHLDRRLAEIAHEIETLDAIGWEIERADAETFADAAETLERIERGPKRARKPVERKRPPIDIALGPDARLYVGRSPQGNAEVTFRIARPGDLWFHTRETPGAHVVLRIDSSRAPEPCELERAAEVAAFFSKARESEKVAVDYTERKHVRRQRNAPPGLVWYTDARTLIVTPRGQDVETASA
jgi:predicted ribosome quality control (RQC) complex YloA/Tae2 family protein